VPTTRVISPTPALGKRQRSSSADIAAPGAATSIKRQALSDAHEERNSGPTGLSRAARADRAAKQAAAEGSLLDAPKRTKKFRRHVNTCDANNGMRKNGKFTKAAASTLKVNTYFEKAVPPNPSARSASSSAHYYPISAALSPESSPVSPRPVLCCGLRLAHHKKLANLIGRSTLGGRQSIHVIAQNRFNRAFKDLTPQEKKVIRTTSSATASWQIHYEPQEHVRSTGCLKECDPTTSEVESGPTDICNKCADLLHMREFRNALNREPAPSETLKFVPHAHRNKQQAVLYGRYVGLEAVIQQAVGVFLRIYTASLNVACEPEL
jgi:hypothetical protein